MDMTFKEIIGERMRLLRKEQKLSRRKLGMLIGLSENSIANWEKGENTPMVEAVVKYSEFFDCPTDYILKGEEW